MYGIPSIYDEPFIGGRGKGRKTVYVKRGRKKKARIITQKQITGKAKRIAGIWGKTVERSSERRGKAAKKIGYAIKKAKTRIKYGKPLIEFIE